MQLTRKQVLFSLGTVAILLAVIVGYGVWNTPKTPPDRYAGLTTSFEVQMDDALRTLVEQRLKTTQAAIAALIAAGDEVGLDLYASVGADAYMLGDLVTAREALEKQLQENSLNFVTWNSYGEVLEKMGDTESALRAYKKSYELGVDVEEFYRDYVTLFALVHPEDPEEVLNVLELTVKNMGQTSWNMLALGRWYAEAADCERAEAHYKVAKALSPKNQAIKDEMAEVKKTCGNVDKPTYSWQQ